MPKIKKEPMTEDESAIDVLGLSHKKHKKHKHKKHKKKKGLEDGDDGSGGGSPETPNENFKPGLRLKIKIGGQTFGEARVSKSEINEASSDESANIDVVDAMPSVSNMSDSVVSQGNSKRAKRVDDDDAWLEALEAGRLEEVDEELRRMKDPTLMTARQRSLLESKAQKEKEDAIPVVAETKVLSEEMIQQKIIQAKKRKKLAEEKKEKDKKQTIDRLLKKPDPKPKGGKKLIKKAEVPKIKYIDNEFKGRSLSFPVGFSFPLKAQIAKDFSDLVKPTLRSLGFILLKHFFSHAIGLAPADRRLPFTDWPPPVVRCGVKGCENRKKYSCSKTGVPLCSLECYRKNMMLNNANSCMISV